ncbi:MAG: hypothetical protein K2Y28_09475 [Burkholderiaceae bacterium]|nr:hypothetical protein [Burkholderiaceae bacterium]
MQIFVFGSNRAGRHGKGAALHAIQHHGAIYGQGEGLQGQSYAIPTKDENIRTLPLRCIAIEVEKFKKFAAEHPELSFNVTAIGCGLAGYIPEQIAPMFSGLTSNVLLPDAFKVVLFCSLLTEKEALQKEVAKLKKTQLHYMTSSDDTTENDYGYYIDIDNELYCDIVKDKQGKWSVFFHDRKTGGDGWGDQVDIDELRAKIVDLEQAALSSQATFERVQATREVMFAFENIRNNYEAWQDNPNFKVLERFLHGHVKRESVQASQPTKCVEFIQHQVIGGVTFNALSSDAQDWIMSACKNYDNKIAQASLGQKEGE